MTLSSSVVEEREFCNGLEVEHSGNDRRRLQSYPYGRLNMLGAAQIIPFHRPPKKEWKAGVEKKKRLFIDLSKEEDGLEEEVPTFYEDFSESSEESEESFDMQEYVAGLLPGEVVDGKKPLKKANTAHLEELRVKKVKKDRWKYFKMLFRFIIRKRREERERRKHYILKEWEQKLKQYVEKEQQAVQAKMEEHRKELLLEQHRSNLRRIRNSKKVSLLLLKSIVLIQCSLIFYLMNYFEQKVEKSAHIELFTADLKRRDLEAKKMNYYCTNLSTWAIEGYERFAIRYVLFVKYID